MKKSIETDEEKVAKEREIGSRFMKANVFLLKSNISSKSLLRKKISKTTIKYHGR